MTSIVTSSTVASIQPLKLATSHQLVNSKGAASQKTLVSQKLPPSSRPGNMRRHSAPARHAPFEFLPNLKDLPEIVVQAPASPSITPEHREHDSSLLKPALLRLSARAKPFVLRARPSISSPPVSIHPLPEQPDLGQGISCLEESLTAEVIMGQQIGSSKDPVTFRTMAGAVYSQEMIRDLVRKALQNAADFFRGFLEMENFSR
ncbi:hypothetical protein DL98DRAFT_575942 [Cadophora sp. DSE1049]|nr:hypothetical protein DL98DRAFT_575942 [Cadophora sp. DSE1049]